MTKAVLITGGATRLGRVIALRLAASGYDVALHYHFSEQEAHETRAEVIALGQECVMLHADLANPAAAEAIVIRAHNTFPHLSALVNNASVFERGPFPDAEQDSYALHMDVNLRAPILLTQAFARVVGKGGVVNILDAKITTDTHSYFYYLLSKKALADFTRMGAIALAPEVRVNGVAPGRVLPDKHVNDGKPLTATPDEVAAAVAALLEDPRVTGDIRFVGA